MLIERTRYLDKGLSLSLYCQSELNWNLSALKWHLELTVLKFDLKTRDYETNQQFPHMLP